ncbi:hypothetical protein C8R45DRAFT_1077739 [Mycena sanguinolenta]|nr:hypothetical protein C8R45DRAFT_1077739 [Mycena sanguinolenta]
MSCHLCLPQIVSSFSSVAHSMARRRRSQDSGTGAACCGSCFLLVVLILIVIAIPEYFRQTIATQKELLSRITSDTPISGFYGPGAWLAWLVTLGMTHGHALRAVMTHGELKHEWDYDLIGASGYTIAAAVDLMSKAKAVSQLGEAANTSSLISAMLSAERVVSVGTGSSLFSLAIAVTSPNSGGLRSFFIAAIALCFAVVASYYAVNAHEAIFKTTPVIWCRFHDGRALGEPEFPFTAVDFPGGLGEATIALPKLYAVREYWMITGMFSAVISFISFVATLVNHREVIVALAAAVTGAVSPVALFVGLPIIGLIGLGIFKWVLMWLLEMDQISAFSGVLVLAALRTVHPLLRTLGHEGAEERHELTPLLPDPVPTSVSEPGPSTVSKDACGVDASDTPESRLQSLMHSSRVEERQGDQQLFSGGFEPIERGVIANAERYWSAV